ncbi:hypothetical protein [Streptomyces milbemycinicus]|uniref:hypothetical protein n=1 Tax=Streptomyces milbemycinicus TaxID=476552 RepID=UPI0029CA730F|nr:hypothetical protein [Streptomyces milbemycinicus]
MGAPTVPAVVVSIGDTGRLVNFDPVVDLVLQPSGTTDRTTVQTVVSKLRIPRTGDQVLLIADPARPGGYLYAGTASLRDLADLPRSAGERLCPALSSTAGCWRCSVTSTTPAITSGSGLGWSSAPAEAAERRSSPGTADATPSRTTHTAPRPASLAARLAESVSETPEP